MSNQYFDTNAVQAEVVEWHPSIQKDLRLKAAACISEDYFFRLELAHLANVKAKEEFLEGRISVLVLGAFLEQASRTAAREALIGGITADNMEGRGLEVRTDARVEHRVKIIAVAAVKEDPSDE